jgi:hypothetical protein
MSVPEFPADDAELPQAAAVAATRTVRVRSRPCRFMHETMAPKPERQMSPC